MADKRTTPQTPEEAPQPASQDGPQDAAQGARRKKRAAPTIDLTATEMPSQETASPPRSDPPPEPAQELPPEPHKAAYADTDGRRPGSHFGLATFAAGVTGAAVVMLVMAGLWLTGLLPLRIAASTDTRAQVAADTKMTDALAQRVSKIEETIKNLPASDPAVAERLAAADNAMKSLGIALSAVNRRSGDMAANVSQTRERADAATKAVAELRASMQDVAKTSSAGVSPAELDALQKRMTALEQSIKAERDEIAKASSTDVAARAALGAVVLRDAVATGAPFTAELAQAKSLGAGDKVLAPLAPFAATGAPTASALAQELRVLLPAVVKISGAQAPEGGFLERLQANAGRLVRIRPVSAPPGDEPSATLARLEIDSAKADIAGALADLGKLADATRAPAQPWIGKAQARQAALAAAQQYAADTARALGPK